MMRHILRRQWLWAVLGVVAALILAFPLRGIIERVILKPLAYLFWTFGLLYRAVPQPVIWVVVLVVMLYVVINSFSRKSPQGPVSKRRPDLVLGPVENLTRLLVQKKTGIYFKWQIARMLSEVALDLQELREHVRSRNLNFHADVNPAVQRYLDAGLNTSFADYPVSDGFPMPARFRKQPKTPFDTDLEPVVKYLESQLESQDDRRRP